MGLVSWFQALRGKSHQEQTRISTAPYQRASRTSTFYNTSAPSSRKPASPAVRRYSNHDDEEEEEGAPSTSGRRKSRALSLSRPKSSHGNNRRSWFGGRADTDEAVPEVPKIVQSTRYAGRGRDIPLSTLPSGPSASSARQAPALDRTFSRPNRDGNRRPIDTLPALSPMPVTVNRSTQPATASLPADKRKSQHASATTLPRRASMASIKSKRRSRSSFWKSSNPDDVDDCDSDVPPVPALTRGDSPDSSRQNTSEDSFRPSRHATAADASSDDTKKTRPASIASIASRRSYVPRSAAKGFLTSTNGASAETRQSFRKSFNVADGVDMVCLTDEQRSEWEKLMTGHLKLADIGKSPDAAAASDHPSKIDLRRESSGFSNSQALAALEFGTR